MLTFPRFRYFLILTIFFFGISSLADSSTEVFWFALLKDGKKKGWIRKERIVAEGKVKNIVTTVTEVRREKNVVKSESIEETSETSTGKPLSFLHRVTSHGSSTEIKGEVLADGNMKVKISVGGKTRELTRPWPKGAILEEGSRLLSLEKGLKPGTHYQFKLFDIDSLTALTAEVKVIGKSKVKVFDHFEELNEFRVNILLKKGLIPMKVFSNDKLDLRKSVVLILGMAMETVICSEEIAKGPNDLSEGKNPGLVKSPQVMKPWQLINPVTYEVAPINPEIPIELPSSGEQQVEPIPGKTGCLKVKVAYLVPPKQVSLPYSGSDSEALQALKPTRYIQSDEKKIIELAKQAVGDCTNAAEASRKIQLFVDKYISKKNYAVLNATALEVAHNREGDCTEHAFLTTALCRAVGIPARVVTGLAYYPKENNFIPHAWTQAYLGKQWVSLDAALRGFDSGRIAIGIGVGGPMDVFDCVNVLGNLKITKITVEGKPGPNGWLGVKIHTVKTGVKVDETIPGSPAAKAGIKPGDIIVSYDFATIKSAQELVRRVAVTPIGNPIKIELIRNKKPSSVKVTIEKRPELPPLTKENTEN